MKWLIDKAEAMPQDLLQDCLKNDFPKVWGAVFPDRRSLKRLGKVYNEHLNPSSIPLDLGCAECRGQLLRYWGVLNRTYNKKV